MGAFVASCIVWKKLIVLGALALLTVPSLAVAQEPPPSPPADDRPSGPPAQELDEPVPTPEPAPAPAPRPPPPPPPPRATTPRPPAEDLDPPRTAPATTSPAPVLPNRSGATFELGIGLGITRVSLENGLSESFGGLAGLNVGLGGWLGPRTALTVRVASTSFFREVEGTEVQFIAGLLGLTLQQMVSNQAWIGGGLGIGVLTTDQDNITPEGGFGLDLRAGVNLYQSSGNAIHLSVEVTPGFYDGLTVTGIGIQLGWQSL